MPLQKLSNQGEMVDNRAISEPWDSLIVTASNAAQAAAYEAQLRLRRELGLLLTTHHFGRG